MNGRTTEYGVRDLATGDVVWRLLSAALAVVTVSPGCELVRRVGRGPWEPCPAEPVATGVTPPTKAEYCALRSFVSRSVHDHMRIDWRGGLDRLDDTWLPFYRQYCFSTPWGDGAFQIPRLKELALSVPIGAGWEALTPVDPKPVQLDLFDLVGAA